MTVLFSAPRIDSSAAPLIDSFGRRNTYLRVSVTDRCDFRCVYCMAEDMQFLPKAEILAFEEIDAIVAAFIAHGLPLRELRDRLASRYTLEGTGHRTGGPVRYVRVRETGGLLASSPR
jgi:hypothetical protein